MIRSFPDIFGAKKEEHRYRTRTSWRTTEIVLFPENFDEYKNKYKYKMESDAGSHTMRRRIP